MISPYHGSILGKYPGSGFVSVGRERERERDKEKI
jgi:hypothetical protein